jgi:hypothetical protein
MADEGSHATQSGNFALLLHPSAVPVLDIFRSRRELVITHDLTLVDEAEAELSDWTSIAFARSVVSEATLLAFSLSRERVLPMDFRVPGSRLTTADERRLMALVVIAGEDEHEGLKAEAAAALDIPAIGLASAAAANLASAIRQAGLQWPAFRLVHAPAVPVATPETLGPAPCADDAAFKFKS